MTNKLPEGFVYLKTIAPTILQELKYAGEDNFLGRPIQGYSKNASCILTQITAERLQKIQVSLSTRELGLKIFDGYRPQMAVEDFIQWSLDPADQKMKTKHYPKVDKADLFTLGYVAKKSGHTRGSTVDLTVINLADQSELDMGTIFDFMDELSHPTSKAVTSQQFANRMMLREIMLDHKFKQATTEWWHFTLEDEPFKDTYFNFPNA